MPQNKKKLLPVFRWLLCSLFRHLTKTKLQFDLIFLIFVAEIAFSSEGKVPGKNQRTRARRLLHHCQRPGFKFYITYSNHLNTEHLNIWFIWILYSMGVQYSNGKVTWLGRPFKYQTFRAINMLFQSDFQTTIWILDHFANGHKPTIPIPD